MENNVVKLTVIKLMKTEGKFREQGFSLHEKFAGIYKDFQVLLTKTGGSKPDNNFRVRCKSDAGNHSLAGYMVGNALVVPSGTVLPNETVKDNVKNVYFFDEAEDVVRSATKMHQIMDEGKDFEFPAEFEVLGACIGKDSVGDHPYIPLSRYPRYGALLNHHKKAEPGAIYITRDSIDYYLTLEGDDRPKGIPEGHQFKLHNHEEAVWEMSNWMPTLIIKDWRKSE